MAKSSTSFQPGQCPNPGGRPKVVAEVRELARAHVPSAIEALAAILKDKDAPPAARVAASNVILDRAAGRPAPADEAVSFALPAITSPNHAVQAAAALVGAVASGTLTPSEAAELGKLVGAYVEAVKLTEIDERLRQIEQGMNQ